MFPNHEILGDLCTSFIDSYDEQFISELDLIKDSIVMGAFLDDNNHKFTESFNGFSNWDKVIDLSANGKAILDSKTIPIAAKLNIEEYLKFKNRQKFKEKQ